MDRYDIDSGPGGDASLGKDPDGPFVLYSDHVAEVERLQTELASMTLSADAFFAKMQRLEATRDRDIADVSMMMANVERLRALLREADAMWDVVPHTMDGLSVATARRFGAIRRSIKREVG